MIDSGQNFRKLSVKYTNRFLGLLTNISQETQEEEIACFVGRIGEKNVEGGAWVCNKYYVCRKKNPLLSF